MEKDLELSIVMPCLNEAKTLAICIGKAKCSLEKMKISGEIIIADNGSTDGSQVIAKASGARVVPVEERGYGAALMGGIKMACGRYVIMGDADDSYDFTDLESFVEKLRQGYDLVMGNRFQGGIRSGAMPFLNRYIGNPVLSWIGRLFFRSPVGDFHCGLRGINRMAFAGLDLRTTGMEFASEMVVKATLRRMRIAEVPTSLSPDGRNRPPHLNKWRDGWRHLRFLLMYSPRWLFLYPGFAFMLSGFLVMAALIPGPVQLGRITSLDIHTMLYAAMLLIVGIEIVLFAVFSKLFGIRTGLLPKDEKLLRVLDLIPLERGLLLGAILSILGLAGSVYAIILWEQTSFGDLIPTNTMRLVIPSLTALAVGIQTIFASFFLSILRINEI